jgi:hypothetical protein
LPAKKLRNITLVTAAQISEDGLPMKAIIMCALLAFGYWAFSQLWLQLNSPTTISEKAEDDFYDFLRTVGKYIRRDYPDAEYPSRLATEVYFAALPYNAQIFLDYHNIP